MSGTSRFSRNAHHGHPGTVDRDMIFAVNTDEEQATLQETQRLRRSREP
jgi:hypothetical protein